MSQEAQGRVWQVLWWGLLVLQLFPVWMVDHLLTQDGPLHLYSAHVFLELWGGQSPVIADTFKVSWHLSPNWVGPLLTAALLALVDAEIAEKILITLIILSMACGYRYLLRCLSCRNVEVQFLIFPFLLSHYLFMGLYPFLLGVGLSFFVIGEYFRCRSRMRGPGLLWMTLLLTVNYFCHLIPAALAGMILILVPASEYVGRKINSKQWLTDSCLLALAGTPSFLLALLFLSGGGGDPIAWNLDLREYLHGMVTMSWLTPYSKSPLPWVLLWAVFLSLFGGWAVWRRFSRSSWQPEDLWIVVAVLVLFLKFAIPEGPRGGSLIGYRLTLFFWASVVVWFSMVGWNLLARRYWVLIVISTLLVSICQPFYVYHHLKKVSQTYADCLEAFTAVPAHCEVMPFCFNLNGERHDGRVVSPRNQLFTHFFQKSAIQGNDVSVSNHFQAEYDLFPVKFKRRTGIRFFPGAFDEAPETFPLSEDFQENTLTEHLKVVVLIGAALDDLPENSPLVSSLKDFRENSRSWTTSIGVIQVIPLAK